MKQYSNSLVETPRHFEGLGKLRYKWVRGVVRSKLVLELGSGMGEGAFFLAINGAKRVLGIDYVRQAVTAAQKKFKRLNLGFRLMNVMELNKLESKFDVVIAFELLEHLDQQQQQKLVKLIRRILKPGGMVVMSTPNRLMFSKGRKKSRHPFHKHELTVEQLRCLFGKEFRKVEIKGVKCVNKESVIKRSRLEVNRWHKMVDWWAKFGWVHELLPLIPKNLKAWVTGEGSLPQLKEDDYLLTDKNIELCDDLWLEARV